ncbi:hypothetical protein Bca52824_016692 [Brassica carinata]|uniref:Uncharacterized protein n=1 Tax=Brassica carinata TaxID=52824 RepID=A0A8X7W5L1_BRACI|nr:hypothetical protein Bca52824_016692 [Brassica carinata]
MLSSRSITIKMINVGKAVSPREIRVPALRGEEHNLSRKSRIHIDHGENPEIPMTNENQVHSTHSCSKNWKHNPQWQKEEHWWKEMFLS